MSGTLAIWYEPLKSPEWLDDARGDVDESSQSKNPKADAINPSESAKNEASNPTTKNEPVPDSGATTQISDTSKGDKASPEVELHFNLWRDLASHSDFFDVGFKFIDTEQLNRFFLFVPQAIDPKQIVDLSPLLEHGSTLNAVFNDVVEIESREEKSFNTEIRKEAFTRVHQVDIKTDLSFKPVSVDTKRVGTIIVFGSELCERIRAPKSKSHYVRIRIVLNKKNHHLFSSEVTPRDWWVLSSFYPMEVTEFRLNERRRPGP